MPLSFPDIFLFNVLLSFLEEYLPTINVINALIVFLDHHIPTWIQPKLNMVVDDWTLDKLIDGWETTAREGRTDIALEKADSEGKFILF